MSTSSQKLRLSDLAVFALPVYVALLLATGFVFTFATEVSNYERHLHYYDEAFFIFLYLSASLSILVLECYVIRDARKCQKASPGCGSDKTPEDTEMNDFSEKQDDTRCELSTGLYTCKRANFYFLLGGMGFGVGTIISDIFSVSDYIRFGQDSCLHPLEVAVFCSHAVFIANQMIFIWKYHMVVIVIDRFLTRFLLLHIIPVNICMWINTVVREAAEEYRHETESRSQELANISHNSTEASCYAERELRTLSSPYLTPCTIEHGLFALPLLYQMYTRSCAARIQFPDPEPVHPSKDRNNVPRHKKLWRMVERIHAGIMVFILTLISVALFFIYLEHFGHEETAQLIFHSTELSLLVLLLVALILSFFYLRTLEFDHQKPASLDQKLLVVATTGHLIYDMSRAVAGIYALVAETDAYHASSSDHLFSTCALLSLLEVLLQTTFLIFAMRLYSEHDHHIERKPGRSLIGFLLLCNLAMWVVNTFALKKAIIVPLFVDYYGYLPWSLISYSMNPLLIFYRFHSTVCLSDIWKEAYQKD